MDEPPPPTRARQLPTNQSSLLSPRDPPLLPRCAALSLRPADAGLRIAVRRGRQRRDAVPPSLGDAARPIGGRRGGASAGIFESRDRPRLIISSNCIRLSDILRVYFVATATRFELIIYRKLFSSVAVLCSSMTQARWQCIPMYSRGEFSCVLRFDDAVSRVNAALRVDLICRINAKSSTEVTFT